MSDPPIVNRLLIHVGLFFLSLFLIKKKNNNKYLEQVLRYVSNTYSCTDILFFNYYYLNGSSAKSSFLTRYRHFTSGV